MNKIKVVISIIFLTLIFISCSSGGNYYTPESVVEANARYMNEEDFDKVMNTIDENSPAYASSETTIQQLFDMYDLNYKIISIKVLDESNDEAKVEFDQKTTKIKGHAFKNNRVTGIHTLKKVGNSWKIFGTEIKNIDYLNK
jgi:PBP1b-binding outer membrane lipoprotein LpoB